MVEAQVGKLEFALTSRSGEATALTADALGRGFDRIVAVGGDGTFNEVVNGFFADGKVPRPEASLGLVPAGTGGDFRRTLGWDTRASSALARLARNETRLVDVGRVEFARFEGGKGARYFLNVSSFGVSGRVVRESERQKHLGGRVGFFVATVRGFLGYRDQKIGLCGDGGAAEEMSVTTVAVANGRYFGGGMQVAPGADPSDGIFDVTVWRDFKLSDFVFLAPWIYSGKHVGFARTRTLRVKTLEAQSDEEVLFEMDGELSGRLPIRVSVLPRVLKLII
jgi:YegS/Rv2252/BmrU family lipid kinase